MLKHRWLVSIGLVAFICLLTVGAFALFMQERTPSVVPSDPVAENSKSADQDLVPGSNKDAADSSPDKNAIASDEKTAETSKREQAGAVVSADTPSVARKVKPRIFGKGHPFTVGDLPECDLKSELLALDKEKQKFAMEWLHSFEWSELDAAANELHADKEGNILYACGGLASNAHTGNAHTSRESTGNAHTKTSRESTGNAHTKTSRGSTGNAHTSRGSTGNAPAGLLDGEANAPVVAEAPVPVASPPAYNSKPGAPFTIYLDFNGGTISGKEWNSSYNDGNAYVCDAWSTDADRTMFSDAEQTVIFRVWKRVSEDFAPFDINVSTDPAYEAVVQAGNDNSVGWVFISNHENVDGKPVDKNGNLLPGHTAAGVAYLGVVDNNNYASVYQPAFVHAGMLSDQEDYIAATSSHEFGHNLNLSHDGESPGDGDYYKGHGSGNQEWRPIMGTGKANCTQFSMGEYKNSTQSQDDLAYIVAQLNTNNGGAGYRADDHGDTPDTATAMNQMGTVLTMPATTYLAGDEVNANEGIIEKNIDVDFWSFFSGAGVITINATPFIADANRKGWTLDIKMVLYNSAGTILATSDPDTDLAASITYTSPSTGVYYISIEGTGWGDPMAGPTGWTDYGSIGQYFLSGTVGLGNNAPTVANPIPDQIATALSVFNFAFAANTFNDADTGDTLTYTATLADNSALPAWLSFNAATRTFSGTPGTADIGTIAVKVTATDLLNASVSDTFNITVLDPSVPDIIAPVAAPAWTRTQTPVLSWTRNLSATMYEVYMVLPNGDIFSEWQTVGSTVSNATATVSLQCPIDLSDGTYVLYIRAWNPFTGSGAWSNPRTFIVNLPLPAPTVFAPVGDTLLEMPYTNPPYPVAKWSRVEDAERYRIWIKYPDGTNYTKWVDVGTDVSHATSTVEYQIPLDLPDGEYVIYVLARNTVKEDGLWSAAKSFTVYSFLVAPTITAPSGTIHNTTPTLTWSRVPGASMYKILINHASGGTYEKWVEVGVDVGQGSSTVSYTLPVVIPLGSHSLSVRAWNATLGDGPLSPVNIFTIDYDEFLIVPTTHSPTADSRGIIADKTPEISWPRVNGAEKYQVYIILPNGEVLNMWLTVGTDVSHATSTVSMTCPNLPIGWNAFYVRAWRAASGYGPWSAAQGLNIFPPEARRIFAPGGKSGYSDQQHFDIGTSKASSEQPPK